MKNNALTAALALASAIPAVPVLAQDQRVDITQDAWDNLQQAAIAGLKPEDGWHLLDGGAKFRRIEGDGSGPAPTISDIVSVNYTARLTNGVVIDSNEGRGPVTFPLRQLIRAWQVAIPHAGVGDTIEIAAPACMAYGPRGGDPIPPNATLFFTIELVDLMVPPGA